MLPKERIFLSFGGFFSPAGLVLPLWLRQKNHTGLSALAREGSLQAPPAHKNNLGGSFPWAFPFERTELAQAFPSFKETWENQPQRLKAPTGAGRRGCGFVGLAQSHGLSWGHPGMGRARRFPLAFVNAVQEVPELLDELLGFSAALGGNPCRQQLAAAIG